MSSPLVSIVMPVYNRETVVGRAIDSVLAQTCSDWELIVVDDGSTDATRRRLERYGNRLALISQQNKGPYAARNAALARARGEFVAFLDSDDIWFPEKLEIQLPLFRDPAVGLVFGDAVMMDYRSRKPRRRPYSYHEVWPPSRGRAFKSLLRYDFIPQSSVVARRECFQKLGFFSLMGRCAADYAQWVKISQVYALDYVNKPVFELALHGSNWSRNVRDLYQSQVPLFVELLEQARMTEAKNELRHFLFNATLNLYLSTGSRSKISVPPISVACRLAWFFQYFLLQVKILARLAVQKYDSRRWFSRLMKTSEVAR